MKRAFKKKTLRMVGAATLVFAIPVLASHSANADFSPETDPKAVPENVSKALSEGHDIQSKVTSRNAAIAQKEVWGTFYTYFQGQSFGVEDLLSGVADILPGQEIHPPHVHAEEEFLMVLTGTGTWHLNGEEFQANAGDMLYAKPWDIHGVSNTGDEVLKFVVWKWNNKNKSAPEQPATP